MDLELACDGSFCATTQEITQEIECIVFGLITITSSQSTDKDQTPPQSDPPDCKDGPHGHCLVNDCQ